MPAFATFRSGNVNVNSANPISPWYDGGAQTALNDVTGQNPGFVDESRNPLTWAQTIDPSITNMAQVRQIWAAWNDDAGIDSRWNIVACINYIREGMAPTNPALRGAASDGTDIGAVPVVTSSPHNVGGLQASGNFVF